MYKNVGVGGRPPAKGCKAGMQLPPSRLRNLPVINGSARHSLHETDAQLSVCITVLCLSQSKSISQLAQLELENTTCQTLSCPTQPSPSITLCAVRVNAVQAAGAVPIFTRTRWSPLTLAAAQ
jgi:hypothetical protein